ncbi:MAG: hypothetical protein IJ706_07785 [Clostridia bacterium]|nr:hypothetical protein [Clostridia bacterium]
MDKKVSTEKFLVTVYKNAVIAINSIADISPETDDPEMKKELAEEYKGYEDFINILGNYMEKHGIEEEGMNPIKKMMMGAGIKMGAMKDDSRSHIAEMMVKGTITGITELGEMLSANEQLPEEVRKFAFDLKLIEETFEERLKKLL